MDSDSDDPDRPPHYPGLRHPINHDPPSRYLYPIASRGRQEEECQSTPLPVREVAMMQLMDRITDRPDWHTSIFDPTSTDQWRDELLGKWSDDELWGRACRGFSWRYPIPRRQDEDYDWEMDDEDMDEEEEEKKARAYLDRSLPPLERILDGRCWDFIVEELKQKARYFETSGVIPTLDACHAVVKSDVLVPEDLQLTIRNAIVKLEEDEIDHPICLADFGLTGSSSRTLVDPSKYPLIYGQTRILEDEVVGVHDAIYKWSGKGGIINSALSRDRLENPYSGDADMEDCWSDRYQSLPANVAFQEDGSVRFTSYVNGLHPEKYQEVYRTLEKLLEKALPLWDQCLTQDEESEELIVGRRKTRMPLEKYIIRGHNNPDEDGLNLDDPSSFGPGEDLRWIDRSMSQTEHPPPTWLAEAGSERWRRRQAKSPHPSLKSAAEISYQPVKKSSLSYAYRDSGLQVLVKIVSLNLPPSTTEGQEALFPAGQWHSEHLMNERIVGSAMYMVDSENVTNEGMEFRIQTAGLNFNEDDVLETNNEDDKEWLCRIWGANLFGGPGIQYYGDVEAHEGMMLAWPNVFQRRALPFKLVDPTKAGHRRYIMFHLVDPRMRILSTANVPPQQREWWFDSIKFGHDSNKGVDLADKRDRLWEALYQKLPAEVCQMIYERLFGAHTSSVDRASLLDENDAKRHRQTLTDERDDRRDHEDERWTETWCYDWWD